MLVLVKTPVVLPSYVPEMQKMDPLPKLSDQRGQVVRGLAPNDPVQKVIPLDGLSI